ncbi:unnamed protein product [Vicia faba]|uniref:Uncharacterized protein n=1 Tax=Vicia faba TaxID=3906 RepID=A0AAV0ZYM1_VICFA|nr:unnamed protein product [Vicia faba]
MSRFRRYKIIKEEPLSFPLPLPVCHSSSLHFFLTETLPFPSFVEESLDLCLLPSHFPADLVRVDSFMQKRVEKQQQLGLQSLTDRVAELESRFEQILGEKEEENVKDKTERDLKIVISFCCSCLLRRGYRDRNGDREIIGT